MGAVARMTPRGTLSVFRAGRRDAMNLYIAAGPDGRMWFGNRFERQSEVQSAIGSVTMRGKVSMLAFGVPRPPFSVASAGDALWMTFNGGERVPRNHVGRLGPGSVVSEFKLAQGQAPISVTLGPDGRIWVTAARQIDPGGYILEIGSFSTPPRFRGRPRIRSRIASTLIWTALPRADRASRSPPSLASVRRLRSGSRVRARQTTQSGS